jgi:TolB-like protein/DNA-binding winged helix-turn-helix (wHTH) protein/Tfp pilus assembly protein PilF
MADRAPAHSRVRFGVFELDLQAGELRKSGVLLHLPPQPFKILTLLASHPAELVTREQIRDQVWGTGTFVDFEHSLNFAIKKIRDALGDDPETPRYIQTLPRRGYRFIAPVDVVAGLVLPTLGPDEAAPVRTARPRWAPLRGNWIVVAVSAAVVAIAAVLFALNLGSVRDRLLTALDLKSAVPPGIESIVVLPLENLSRDPEQEYFADGLTDSLITDLGNISTMRVISRTSVMQYKRTRKPLPEIARELNVDAAVEGTVQRSGGRIRITAQLLNARTDRHLWAQTYERDSEDVIRLERQMALAIAREVTGRLTPAQETRLARSTTTNPRAYDAYLRGRYLFDQRTEGPVTAAIGYYEQALREDPHFALAYSGLADCYSVAWWTKGDLSLAEKYARKALALEPDLAEGHASLGIIDTFAGKFADAEKELKRALDLNPNYVMAHHWRSVHLQLLGRPEEALAENERARQLDPFSLPVNHLRVGILLCLRQYDRAVEQAETEAVIDPQSALPYAGLARIYWIEGRVPDALAEERKVATLWHLTAWLRDLDEVAAAFARAGLRAAQVKSAQLKEKGYKDPYAAIEIAYQYGIVEDKGKVLEWLNQAFRDNALDDIYHASQSAPELDCVRSDPRFHDLLRRKGLEQ